MAEGEWSGWLHKQGHAFNTDFKRRWFVLRANCKLSYYEDQAAASKGKGKGTVTITRVRHLRRAEGGTSLDTTRAPTAFYFDTAEKKPFIVYADTVKEKLEWLQVLLAATRSSKPASAMSSGVDSCVEDTYREQVSAVEAGQTSALEPAAAAAWKAVSDGYMLSREGRIEEARAAYGRALQQSGHGQRPTSKEPVVVAALYETGKLLCEVQEYATALEQFEQVLAFVPPEVAGHVRLQCAWCHWQLGDGARSEAIYSQVLEHDPICWQALLDRARMYLSQGAWTEALPDLELVVHLGQVSAEMCNDLGVCYYELGDVARALESFNRAIHLDPGYAQSYTNRGNCYRKLAARDGTMIEGAEHDYSKAVELDPSNPKSYNNRGALLLKMCKYSEAFADFEHALELQPEYEVARRNLDVAHERRAKQMDSAAARGAQLYERRASGGEAPIYLTDAPAVSGAACGAADASGASSISIS